MKWFDFRSRQLQVSIGNDDCSEIRLFSKRSVWVCCMTFPLWLETFSYFWWQFICNKSYMYGIFTQSYFRDWMVHIHTTWHCSFATANIHIFECLDSACTLSMCGGMKSMFSYRYYTSSYNRCWAPWADKSSFVFFIIILLVNTNNVFFNGNCKYIYIYPFQTYCIPCKSFLLGLCWTRLLLKDLFQSMCVYIYNVNFTLVLVFCVRLYVWYLRPQMFISLYVHMQCYLLSLYRHMPS